MKMTKYATKELDIFTQQWAREVARFYIFLFLFTKMQHCRKLYNHQSTKQKDTVHTFNLRGNYIMCKLEKITVPLTFRKFWRKIWSKRHKRSMLYNIYFVIKISQNEITFLEQANKREPTILYILLYSVWWLFLFEFFKN